MVASVASAGLDLFWQPPTSAAVRVRAKAAAAQRDAVMVSPIGWRLAHALSRWACAARSKPRNRRSLQVASGLETWGRPPAAGKPSFLQRSANLEELGL